MIKAIYIYFHFKIALWYLPKNQQKGIEILKKIVGHYPQCHYAHFHLGYTLLKLNPIQAEQYFESSLNITPNNPVYRAYYAVALMEQDKFEVATTELEKASHVAPKNQMIKNYLAICYLKNNNFYRFSEIVNKEGFFESSEVQIRMLLALENYLTHLKGNSSELESPTTCI